MDRLSKLRGSESYRRRQGRKAPRSITLIVCEGETEQEYFEAARIKYGLTTAEVILAENTRGSASISVVECAEGKCGEPGGYDQIFCVFDRDGHESFDRARDKIKALSARKKKPLPINEAISVPCFELWVLLHFEKSDAPYGKCVEVINRVCSYIPGYEKADAAISKQLMAKVNVAIENADWLEGRAETNNFNPFTSVHKVLQHFATVGQ